MTNITNILEGVGAAGALASDAKLKHRIERSIGNPPENSRVLTITPAIATWILDEFNISNRSKKPMAVTKYAGHMLADTWQLTGDTLKFSDEKLLRDGQNRLLACVRSGKPFRTHVVFGIPDDAFAYLDQGKTRKAADVLQIDGAPNSEVVSAIVRQVIRIEANDALSRATVEPVTIRESYRAMPPERLTAAVKIAMAGKTQHAWPVSHTGALAYCLLNTEDRAKAVEFFSAFGNGLVGGKFKPIGYLIKAINQVKLQSFGRVHDGVRFMMLVNAWNLFKEGKAGSVRAITWSPGQPIPTI